MAIKVLIIGESGTGKSTSMRNLNPEKTAIINPVGKPLPFRSNGKIETLNNVTNSGDIIKAMDAWVENGKKVIVVDDFQYILSIPYMDRIKESGWDKWNDFGSNYFDIINKVNSYPDDVIVYFMSHCETLENGITTVKLIGKMLREKITIEGLFTIVLKTGVKEGHYYFYTQNDGKDTVKSPLDMFRTYAIDNDLNYVDQKIRSFYGASDAMSDAEITAMDKKAEVEDVVAPTNRRSRGERAKKNAEAEIEARDKAFESIANGREEIPFDEVTMAMEAKEITKDGVIYTENGLPIVPPDFAKLANVEPADPEKPAAPVRRTRKSREA